MYLFKEAIAIEQRYILKNEHSLVVLNFKYKIYLSVLKHKGCPAVQGDLILIRTTKKLVVYTKTLLFCIKRFKN